jgi:hypothetical protein
MEFVWDGQKNSQDVFPMIRMKKIISIIFIIQFVFGHLLSAGQYVHQTIVEPVRDVLNMEAPEILGNTKLAALGLVDVTAVPFSADPTGKSDSTRAIQQAINFARDHQMVCFFPSGVYTISDTLSCVQGYYRRQHGKVSAAPNFPCVLVGSQMKGKARPKIVLAPHSPGFGNPEKSKYLVHFWARSIDNPNQPQPNICFNQMFIGIDITIGRDNPGAIGIRLRGAQGSGVQDCRIDATHGLVGLEGGCGSGGSHAGITIIGGKIGMDLRETQPAPTITGITLVNQRETAILYGGRQTLCAVGIRVLSESTGPVIKIAPEWDVYFQGPLVLIDSEIVFNNTGDENLVLSANRSFYLRNVYVNGAAGIAVLPNGPGLAGNPRGWLHIREYAQRIKSKPYRGLQYESSIFIDGRVRAETYIDTEPNRAPPKDLQQRHLWSTEFPSWQSENAANVKHAPYKAKGDGVTDDTIAIQKAIDKSETVFLPKGIYRVTRTIRLRPDTKIIGIGKAFSILAIRGTEDYFTDSADPRPVLETADTKYGRTIMAFCGIYVPYEVPGAYALKWCSGKGSICRDVDYMLMPAVGYGARIPEHAPRITAFVKVCGNGGGKWYNFELGKGLADPGYRQILVDGTSEPLSFYHCCPEGARSEANMEIRNAQHVYLYGVKGEGNTYILWIRDCDHIGVFGYGGNASAREGDALFRIEDTPNFVMANIVDHPMPKGKKAIRGAVGTDPQKYHMIIERTPNAEIVKTQPLDRPVLYRQGNPR